MAAQHHGCSLRVEGLSKSYGSSRVLDDVSFTVDAGQFFTLLGPSGSGKTTILKIVAGFVVQDDGEVYADDRELSREPPYRRDIGLVFQNYALFPHMTVAANVGFPLRMRKVPRTEAEQRGGPRRRWGGVRDATGREAPRDRCSGRRGGPRSPLRPSRENCAGPGG